MQKDLRDWFLKRNPKIKSLLDFSVKILPDFILQELLLLSPSSLLPDNHVDSEDDFKGHKSSNPRQLTFQDYYTMATRLAHHKVESMLKAYLPLHYCRLDEENSPLKVSAWILMEMLRPELYRKCSLFIHHHRS